MTATPPSRNATVTLPQAAFAVAMEERRPALSPRPDLTMFTELIESCWQQLPSNRPDMDTVVQQLIKLDAQVSKEWA